MPVTTAGGATQAVEGPHAHAENLATSATVTGRFGVSAYNCCTSAARRRSTASSIARVETSDKSTAGFETECETFTTHEDGIYKCLLAYGDIRGSGGQTQRVRDGTWVLDTGASGQFTHDSTKSCRVRRMEYEIAFYERRQVPDCRHGFF